MGNSNNTPTESSSGSSNKAGEKHIAAEDESSSSKIKNGSLSAEGKAEKKTSKKSEAAPISSSTAKRHIKANEGAHTEETEDPFQGDQDTEGFDDLLNGDDKIPMVFRWDGGGKNVYITGTFNAWKEKIPMRRSGNDFIYIRNLKRGRHAYKFIVDDEWRFAVDQPTVADPHGYINNFVDLTNFKEEYGADMPPLSNRDHITDDALFANFSPDPNDPQWYAKEPPALPLHLRQIILNTPQSNDCLAAKSMQLPQHVTLNHLYCSAIKENLMVLGVSQRYREKFVTTVFYSPLPDLNLIGRAAAAASVSDGKMTSPKSQTRAPELPKL